MLLMTDYISYAYPMIILSDDSDNMMIRLYYHMLTLDKDIFRWKDTESDLIKSTDDDNYNYLSFLIR